MNEINLDKCCRICLQIKRTNKMKLLSTIWKDSLSLDDMLTDVAKVDVVSDSGLKICSICEQDLITAYNFKIVCQNTDRILADRLMPPIEEIKLEPFKEIQDLDKETKEELIAETELPKKRIRKPKSTLVKKKQKEDITEILENGRLIDGNEAAVPIVTETKTKRCWKNRKPSLTCKRCVIKFETNQEYKRHRENVHWTSYPCTICGKLILEHRLANHMLSHSDEKNFVCTICGNRFTYRSGLKEHMRIHTGERRYKCDFCDERFIHWNSKKNHIYIKHTKEKKYECHYCHRRFPQLGSFKVHLRYHSGDLPFECPRCHKRYGRRATLKCHLLSHDKPDMRYKENKMMRNVAAKIAEKPDEENADQ